MYLLPASLSSVTPSSARHDVPLPQSNDEFSLIDFCQLCKLKGNAHIRGVQWAHWVSTVDPYIGSVQWVRTMDPYIGLVQWVSTVGPYNGTVPWVSTVGPYNGSVQWVSTVGPYNGSVQRVCSVDPYSVRVQWARIVGSYSASSASGSVQCQWVRTVPVGPYSASGSPHHPHMELPASLRG